MKAKVTARAFDRLSGKAICDSRDEIVSTTEQLFKKCKTILEIKNVYESFWNELNPRSKEIVFVSRVEILK